MRLILISALILAFLSISLSIFVYPNLPERVADHWNMNGVADGFSSRGFGLFLLPLASLLAVILLYFIPALDPLKENIWKFQKYYDGVILAMVIFFLYIQTLIIIFNKGFVFDMSVAIIPAFSLLFIFIGIVLKKTKRNWIMGIRTPWALSHDKVWEGTHRFAGNLFIASGIISLAGLFFASWAIWFILIPVLISAIASIINSYIEFRKINSITSKKKIKK